MTLKYAQQPIVYPTITPEGETVEDIDDYENYYVFDDFVFVYSDRWDSFIEFHRKVPEYIEIKLQVMPMREFAYKKQLFEFIFVGMYFK
jgi:hypothetical protein